MISAALVMLCGLVALAILLICVAMLYPAAAQGRVLVPLVALSQLGVAAIAGRRAVRGIRRPELKDLPVLYVWACSGPVALIVLLDGIALAAGAASFVRIAIDIGVVAAGASAGAYRARRAC